MAQMVALFYSMCGGVTSSHFSLKLKVLVRTAFLHSTIHEISQAKLPEFHICLYMYMYYPNMYDVLQD